MIDEQNEMNGVQSAIEAGKAAVQTEAILNDDGGKHIRLPSGFKLEKITCLNPMLPKDVSQTESLIEQKSFTDYVNRFKGAGTIIRANPSCGKMNATLDYHKPSNGAKAEPNRCSHNIDFNCDFDENWKRWRKIDGRELSQTDFAYFVEEMLHTIGEPNGADLLDMAENLKINRGVAFQSGKRLSNGTMNIKYTEVDEAKSNGGDVTVPEDITIVSPIYMLRKAISIKAKLRYRMEKGQPLVFIVDILNREVIEFEDFKLMADEVAKATECPVYLSK